MKVLVPAKARSSRVPDKNWRPFHEGRSLVEIKLTQLLRTFAPDDIYLSCDDPTKRAVVERLGVKFLLRDPAYADDDMHWSDVVSHLVGGLPCDDDEDVAWVEVVAPLFAEYGKVVQTWENVKGTYDSLATVKPVRQFLLDDKGRGVNFNPGRWHCWSQDLPPLFSLEAMTIMSKRDVLRYAYVIGRKPYLFPIEGASVDIDDMYQFDLAQRMYGDLRP